VKDELTNTKGGGTPVAVPIIKATVAAVYTALSYRKMMNLMKWMVVLGKLKPIRQIQTNTAYGVEITY